MTNPKSPREVIAELDALEARVQAKEFGANMALSARIRNHYPLLRAFVLAADALGVRVIERKGKMVAQKRCQKAYFNDEGNYTGEHKSIFCQEPDGPECDSGWLDIPEAK